MVEPKTASFRFLFRYLQPLLTPDTLHPLVVNIPTMISEQSRNPAVPVTAVLTSQLYDVTSQNFFITLDCWVLSLG
jgi:hypothetical protein